MTPLEIEVTAEDIREGRPDCCSLCPVALAIQRAAETRMLVYVDPSVATVWTSDGWQDYRLPREAQDFIIAFDSLQPVAPFTFRLE